MIVFIDAIRKKIVCSQYTNKEGYDSVYYAATYLKERGVYPIAFTLDGHKAVIAAITSVWPGVIIQRCLFHIQRQGLSWIRTYPKTEAGRQLKQLLLGVTAINTYAQRDIFINSYLSWNKKFQKAIQELPNNSIANKDLKRTMALINNALPNMFFYLKDPQIVSTTNFLENFYSQLKHHYQRHRGLTQNHKQSFLRWFCYFKNQHK